jgi:hypothetical protein
MERGTLRLNWHRFFCSMTPQTEAALALCLADIGLSLGEYMELMEESYIQTIAESGEAHSSRAIIECSAKQLASKRLQSYARAKRRFVLARRGESHRILLPPPVLPGGDPISLPAPGFFSMMAAVDRDSLRDQNRRLIREVRNDHS